MWAAEAADRMRWNRTRAVMVQLANVNRDPKKSKWIDPERFFPWDKGRTRRAPSPSAEDRKMLREVFPKG